MVSFDRQSIKRSVESLGEYPELAASYTLYKALTALFVLVTPHVPSVVPQFAGPIATPYTCYFLCIALWCIVFAVFGRNARCFERKEYLWQASSVLVLGILLLASSYLFGSQLGEAGEVLFWLQGIILATGGYSAVHIEFGRLMGYLGMTYTLIFNVGCLVISLPLVAVLLILPLPAMFLSVLLCSVMCIALLRRAFSRLDREKVFRRNEEPLSIPVRFMVTSFTQGISVGLLFTVFTCGAVEGFWGESAASLVAAVAALLFGLTFRVSFDRLIYRIGFAAIGVGCMLWAVSGGFAPLQQASAFLQLASYTYLDIVLWSLGSHLIKDRNQPALWVASCPTASLLSGRCIGSVIGARIAALPLLDGGSLPVDLGAVTAAAASCIFLLVALELTSSNNIQTGWGFIKPNEGGMPSAQASACALIAGDFHLTDREREVLELLAQGKNKKEIAEELFVTANTIKTHQRNLYAKLGVHSLEELKKFIDHQQGAFKPRS